HQGTERASYGNVVGRQLPDVVESPVDHLGVELRIEQDHAHIQGIDRALQIAKQDFRLPAGLCELIFAMLELGTLPDVGQVPADAVVAGKTTAFVEARYTRDGQPAMIAGRAADGIDVASK